MATDREYEQAADAVQRGDATPRQKELNDKMARQMGRRGTDARAAQQGKKKW